MKTTKIFFLILIIVSIQTYVIGESYRNIDQAPDLPSDVWKLAQEGWKLYKAGNFKNAWNGGHYTDPDPNIRGSAFWSNGVYAQLDPGGDGHFEVFFIIYKDQLKYAGTIGGRGIFEKVDPDLDYLMGVSIGVLIDLCVFSFGSENLKNRFKIESASELPSHVWQLAQNGLNLYKAGEIKRSSRSGHYTDPDLDTKVFDFWTNGVLARLDSDDNGSHETIFVIYDNQLKYVGKIGSMGVFEAATPEYKLFLGKTLQDLYLDWLTHQKIK